LKFQDPPPPPTSYAAVSLPTAQLSSLVPTPRGCSDSSLPARQATSSQLPTSHHAAAQTVPYPPARQLPHSFLPPTMLLLRQFPTCPPGNFLTASYLPPCCCSDSSLPARRATASQLATSHHAAVPATAGVWYGRAPRPVGSGWRRECPQGRRVCCLTLPCTGHCSWTSWEEG
jgi:hypothetical protein